MGDADGELREGVWSAPGRVNLIGDHTDYNGGFAMPFALPLRTTVRARRRDDSTLVAHSTGHDDAVVELPGRTGEVTGWGAYVAGVAWALGEAGVDVPGAELTISSEVPLGAGLSSSHSLECAVALALTGLAGVEVPRADLARIVQRSENDYVGAPTGLLDQMASLMSQDHHVSLLDARALTVDPIPCRVDEAGLEFLVIDSHAPHQLTDGGYASRRAECEHGAALLGVSLLREVTDGPDALASLEAHGAPEGVVRRVRHVLTENARVLEAALLLRAGDLVSLGPVLTASHASMRDDFANSVPAIDLIVAEAVAAGALGARMTGGGFGGSVVALSPVSARADIEAAVSSACAEAGYAAPTYLAVIPSAGAGRDA